LLLSGLSTEQNPPATAAAATARKKAFFTDGGVSAQCVQVAPKSGPRPQIRCFRLSGTQFLPVGSVESNAVYISQLTSTAAVYRLQNRQLTFATYGAPALIDKN